MRKVRVLSRKYDGSLRDECETCLHAETDAAVTLFCPPGLLSWDHRKAAWQTAPDGALEIYFKRRWYHVWHICEQTSNLNLMYIHIAMPATFQTACLDRVQTRCLEWTDLDLDYRVHPDNSVEQLDQDEFERNAQRMGYPPGLIEQVRLACREVESLLAGRTYPFDHARQVDLYRRIKEELSSG
jgi:protein associated with RNAse G/E